MTEKRFQYNVNKNSIEYNKKHFAYCNVEQNKITNKLNKLNDENEQLKQRNKRFEEKIQRERNSFTKTHERWSKEAETKIKELSEENEQLKRQIGNLEHTRDFCADVLADFERIEKENQEIKNDEKQLSIDFLGYKMKLRKVLQRGYDKAKGQTLYADVFLEIAREMGVDLE